MLQHAYVHVMAQTGSTIQMRLQDMEMALIMCLFFSHCPVLITISLSVLRLQNVGRPSCCC